MSVQSSTSAGRPCAEPPTVPRTPARCHRIVPIPTFPGWEQTGEATETEESNIIEPVAVDGTNASQKSRTVTEICTVTGFATAGTPRRLLQRVTRRYRIQGRSLSFLAVLPWASPGRLATTTGTESEFRWASATVSLSVTGWRSGLSRLTVPPFHSRRTDHQRSLLANSTVRHSSNPCEGPSPAAASRRTSLPVRPRQSCGGRGLGNRSRRR